MDTVEIRIPREAVEAWDHLNVFFDAVARGYGIKISHDGTRRVVEVLRPRDIVEQ